MLKVILAFVAVVAAAEAFVPVIPEIHKPLPYSFGYTVKDKHGEQHREETGDGVGHVKGSYGFTDERGIHRQVHYVADKAGFRAEVKTNEHGTAPLHPAAVKMESSAHPYLGGAGAIGVWGLKPLAAAPLPFGPKPLAAGLVPLAAGPLPVGVPLAAPALAKGGLGMAYGGPLKAGFVKGYDTRFGVY